MKLKRIIVISLLAGAASVALAAAPPVTTVGPQAKPDQVATDLMHEPIYPFSVHSLAFSPDGKWLLTGLGNGTVRIWDANAGETRLELPAHTNWAFALRWFPGGKRFATGGGDNLIQIFELNNFLQPFATLNGHTNDVHAVAITPDGRTLVSAGDDRMVLIWDVKTRKVKRSLAGHTAQIPTVALNPRGNLIATDSRDRSIRLWALPDGKEIAVLNGHESDVMSLQFSPDGQRLVSAGYDRTVRIWDVEHRSQLHVLTGHTHRAMSVAFAPSGKLLASAGDRSLRFWEPSTGAPIASIVPGGQIDTGHRTVNERLSALSFRPDGKRLAVGSTTGAVYIFEIPSGTLVQTLTAPKRE